MLRTDRENIFIYTTNYNHSSNRTGLSIFYKNIYNVYIYNVMQVRSLTSLCLLDKQEWNNLTFSPFDDSIQNAHQSQSNIFIILLIRFTMGIRDTTLTLPFICGSI